MGKSLCIALGKEGSIERAESFHFYCFLLQGIGGRRQETLHTAQSLNPWEESPSHQIQVALYLQDLTPQEKKCS